MRLDYYLAHAESMSRKDAKIAVSKGMIKVNGVLAKKANQTVQETDEVVLNGRVLIWQSNRYLMLYKPTNFVCANQDAENAIVMDLLPANILKDLNIVGRLDKDTTGLLFLTTDGQWLHRITSPKYDCHKTYLVDLAEPIADEEVQLLENGILLRGEAANTLPAKVERVQPLQIRLTIAEGKYHQVKRMMGAIGNKVVRLHREKIGNIELDDQMQPGDFRDLTAAEINQFI